MHLTNWNVRRSGAFVTVHGTDETGKHVKFSALEIEGPDAARVALPDRTVAWRKNGDPVVLLT